MDSKNISTKRLEREGKTLGGPRANSNKKFEISE